MKFVIRSFPFILALMENWHHESIVNTGTWANIGRTMVNPLPIYRYSPWDQDKWAVIWGREYIKCLKHLKYTENIGFCGLLNTQEITQ